ncbi:UTP--glucose-1-phosphate uridylyltransferase [Micromonospora sp. C28SCA-DRY-2]|uniref:UTP--glucose-1-phosphate uridylyltransferase n=1 Tax=Micromonospora sp. C28SCA-DRY-2 TaxID=3059522 RepID=UPI002676655E|nr:UTP--glucose-1-phosphate uridylyltransferase [Micromonospora sp. C28SCA-DRY-2]MDO3701350.1 UTP--glucose-1-phosphate uridylyltransferase [Micromonospora sp. C28SCA-DRY-2]
MSEHSAKPSTATAATGRSRAVKAVIPAAGLATRFLPATKAVPKELLPVVDRPVLQYIVEEATQAGITDVLLITGRGKTSMVDHFDRRPDLEARLEKKPDILAAVQRPSELADIYTVRQPEQLGLGHAVGYAESHVGDQPFAVLLGDEFVKLDQPLLPAMLELQARTGGVVLAFFEVDPAETKRYGIASVEPAEAELTDIGEVVKVTGMVEKPQPEEAPSNLAVLGRYVLPGAIFDAIRRTEPGSGGEIQLTDAMEILRNEGVPVHAIVYRGTRYDTGMPLGYLQTVVQIAAEREDLGAEFRKWLVEFVNADTAGGSGT